MHIKSVIFDFDGTLADTMPVFLDGVNKLAPKYNYTPIKDPEPFRKLGIKDFLQKGLELNTAQLLLYIRHIKKTIKSDLYQAELFADIPEIINTLQKKFHLAIISGNNKHIIKHVVKKNHIDHFTPIYGNTRHKKQKHIKHFLRKNNYKNHEVIYIGDGIGDIISCKKAGIPIISVARGLHHPETLKAHKPEFFAEQPKEILNIISKIIA